MSWYKWLDVQAFSGNRTTFCNLNISFVVVRLYYWTDVQAFSGNLMTFCNLNISFVVVRLY